MHSLTTADVRYRDSGMAPTDKQDKFSGQHSAQQSGFVSYPPQCDLPKCSQQRADHDDIPMITRFNTHTNKGDWHPPVPTLGKEGFSNRM
jgi:hypothetical protein